MMDTPFRELSTPHNVKEALRSAIRYDDGRPSLRYEHAATLVAGVGLALCALLTPRRSVAVGQALVAGALLLRAASGRDGLRKWSGAHGARPVLDDLFAEEPQDDEVN